MAFGLFLISTIDVIGENGVCRNLVRICAVICATFLDASLEGEPRKLGPNAATLLLKAVNHQTTNICALALPVLSSWLQPMPILSTEVLPLLQRRAILPHRFQDGVLCFPSGPSDDSEFSFSETILFRNTVLCDALYACWQSAPKQYIDSCNMAVQEFCSTQQPTEASFQLEAALFCIEVVVSGSATLDGSQMCQLLNFLSLKPASLLGNTVTCSRVCKVLAAVCPTRLLAD